MPFFPGLLAIKQRWAAAAQRKESRQHSIKLGNTRAAAAAVAATALAIGGPSIKIVKLCGDCLRLPELLQTIQSGDRPAMPTFFEELMSERRRKSDTFLNEMRDMFPEEFAETERRGERMIPNSHFLFPEEFTLPLKPSFTDMQKSAVAGCDGCRFWSGFVPPEVKRLGGVGIHLKLSKIPRISFLADPDDVFYMDFDRDVKPDNGLSISRPQFQICSSQMDPASFDARITSRIVPKDPRSDDCMLRLSLWLLTCERSHEDCRHSSATLPTRVLDIGEERSGDDTVCLLVTDGASDRYIALSYCWGDSSHQPIKTMTANFNQRTKGIAMAELNQVFRDAVFIARNLGIRYLWVDALCIIQDSAEDWAAESSKMADVYRNAYLTVVAACSGDSDTEFLQPRPGAEPTLQMPFQSAMMPMPGTIALRPYPGTPPYLRPHWEQPVQQRVWTLQEEFLSTRIVFFDAHEMLLECASGREWEHSVLETELDGREATITGRRGNDNFAGNLSKARPVTAWTRKTVPEINAFSWKDKYSQIGFNEHWHSLLCDFGVRRITYTSDTLFALSGMAKKFAADNGDEYLAGIWKRDFRKGLLWAMRSYPTSGMRVDAKVKELAASLPDDQRRTAESGPSWSWASRFTEPDVINFCIVSTQKPLQEEHDAQLVEVVLDPLFGDPYANLNLGMLKLSGYTTNVELRMQLRDVEGYEGVKFLVAQATTPNAFHRLFKELLDSLEEYPSETLFAKNGGEPLTLQALIVEGYTILSKKSNYRSGKRPAYYGLLLRPVKHSVMKDKDEEWYQRVGIFSMEPEVGTETMVDPTGNDMFLPVPDAWSGWEKRTVVVI